MLHPNDKIALFMEGHLKSDYGKMGFGVLRYAKNPIVAVIDTEFNGKSLKEITRINHSAPIVATVEDAHALGAEVLVLGIAPSGGRIPADWLGVIEKSLHLGLSIVNGLHDLLGDRYKKLCRQKEQWIWDVRIPQSTPPIATAQAAKLTNKRVLFIGTDMAAGKMTAGLELYQWAQQQHISTGFVATGQIGITLTGRGIPLDAFKVDLACGAVEQAVLAEQEKELILIEGQGSLLHPGSTATLPLMRGSCPTHLVLCHRADKTHLKYPQEIEIPPLTEFIALNEALVAVCGTYPAAKVVGIALNTSSLNEDEAQKIMTEIEIQTACPTTDVVRYGSEKIGRAIQNTP